MLNLFVLLRGQVHRLTPTFIIEPFLFMCSFGQGFKEVSSAPTVSPTKKGPEGGLFLLVEQHCL